MKSVKIMVEKHSEGYVADPFGFKYVMVGRQLFDEKNIA